MANLGTTFDAHNVAPSSPFEVLPAGKYLMQIVNSEMRDTKSGEGQYLWMELEIIDGPHSGKKQWERLNLVNPNAQAVEISQRTLSAICHATGKMAVSDSEMLHFIPMLVTVKVKPAGPDRSGTHREAQNLIGGYEAASGPRSANIGLARDVASAEHRASAPAAAAKVAAPPWKRTAA